MRKRRWGVRGLWIIANWCYWASAPLQIGAAAQVEIVSEQMFLIASEQGPDINVLHLMTIRNVGFDTVQEVRAPGALCRRHKSLPTTSRSSRFGWRRRGWRISGPSLPGRAGITFCSTSCPCERCLSPCSAICRILPITSHCGWIQAAIVQRGLAPAKGPRGALTFRGYETFEGVTFGIYQMEGVPVVDTWQVVIEPIDRREHMRPLDNNLIHGDPTVFFAAIKEWAIPWLFPWGVCVAVLGMLGVLLVRRRRHGDSSALKRLKDSLVDLDMRFRRGEMDELTYRHMRNELKEEALSLMERDARRAHHSGRDEVGVKDGV